jgi:TBCC domain-containing protein 1
MAGPDAGSSGPGLHVRREPFEFGLLPLSSLYHKFVDGVPAFIKLKARLQQQAGASASGPRVQAAAIAESLSISPTHAQLLLDTLACVLPEDGPDADPLATTTAGEVESVGADVDILVLFLFVQLYRRLPFRPHRDPASVADVWPQPSPFDNIASSPSLPLQVIALLSRC